MKIFLTVRAYMAFLPLAGAFCLSAKAFAPKPAAKRAALLAQALADKAFTKAPAGNLLTAPGSYKQSKGAESSAKQNQADLKQPTGKASASAFAPRPAAKRAALLAQALADKAFTKAPAGKAKPLSGERQMRGKARQTGESGGKKLTEPEGAAKSRPGPAREFADKKNSLAIHNKAIEFLKAGQKTPALLLLKRNAYQNFFPPSYLTLISIKADLSFAPLLWHIACLFSTLACLIFLIFAFKRASLFRLKLLLAGLVFSGCFIISGLFFLKKRVSPLEETDLKSAPFASASVEGSLEPALDLIVLKETDKWLRVKSPDKRAGWIPKSAAFQIF